MIHARPTLAKSVLRLSLKQLQRSPYELDPSHPALLPDSLIGAGVARSGSKGAPEPDDFELYLLLAAAEYILATKDVAFLAEALSGYNSTDELPVLTHLLRAANFTLDDVGRGPHGLLRLLSSDWDDGFKPPATARNLSESVLSSALAALVLPKWASVLRLVGGHSDAAARADAFADGLKHQLLTEAWDPAGWLRRAWLGPSMGWVGSSASTDVDGGVFSAPVGWALLAGVFDDVPARGLQQVGTLLTHCRGAMPIGFPYRCRQGPLPPGSGAWPAQNHPMVMGLARVNGSVAWDEFARNSLEAQAAWRPDRWLGVWTSSDEIRRDSLPGNWTNDFPALCTHRHAWPLVSFAILVGLRPTTTGISLSPSLPPRLGPYEYDTPLAGARWDGRSKWSGHYAPLATGAWQLRVDVAPLVAAATEALGRVSGMRVTLSALAAGCEPAVDTGHVDPSPPHGCAPHVVVARAAANQAAPLSLRSPLPTRYIAWVIVADGHIEHDRR